MKLAAAEKTAGERLTVILSVDGVRQPLTIANGRKLMVS